MTHVVTLEVQLQPGMLPIPAKVRIEELTPVQTRLKHNQRLGATGLVARVSADSDTLCTWLKASRRTVSALSGDWSLSW